YIGSGPIQIDKADSRASGLGVVQLQSGRHRVSATRESRSDNVHQLEFSGKGNRLFISGIMHAMTFEVEADRATYDYEKKRLLLASDGECSVRLLRDRGVPAEVIRARTIVLHLNGPKAHYEAQNRPWSSRARYLVRNLIPWPVSVVRCASYSSRLIVALRW